VGTNEKLHNRIENESWRLALHHLPVNTLFDTRTIAARYLRIGPENGCKRGALLFERESGPWN